MPGAETRKVWIAWPSTSILKAMGASALAGRSLRMRSMASLVSCTACSVGTSMRNMTTVCDWPSVTVDWISSMPVIEAAASSTSRYLPFPFGRRGAALGDGDRHQRHVDVRKTSDRQLVEGLDADEQQQAKGEQRRDRISDRPGGEIHQVVLVVVCAASRTGVILSPSPRTPTPGLGDDFVAALKAADNLDTGAVLDAGRHLHLLHRVVLDLAGGGFAIAAGEDGG